MTQKQPPNLGGIIRHIRSSNNWTLAEMSKHVGIPLSTLAKVEQNRLTLTYDRLIDLSEKLGMRLSDLLNLTQPDSAPVVIGRRSVGSINNVLRVETRNYDYRYLCTELRGKIIIPILVQVRSRTTEEFGDLVRHAGEEFIYVLEGAIEVHTEFYDPVRLPAGEYIYLDSEMGHGFLVADGLEEALILSICAGRTQDLQHDLISLAQAGAAGRSQERTGVPAPLPGRSNSVPKGVGTGQSARVSRRARKM